MVSVIFPALLSRAVHVVCSVTAWCFLPMAASMLCGFSPAVVNSCWQLVLFCEICVETWDVWLLPWGELLVCLLAAVSMGDGQLPWPKPLKELREVRALVWLWHTRQVYWCIEVTLLIYYCRNLWGVLPVLIMNIFHSRKWVTTHRPSGIWWVEICNLSVISSLTTCIIDCLWKLKWICRFYLSMFCITINNIHCWLRSRLLSKNTM